MTSDPHLDESVTTLVSAGSPHTVVVFCHGRGASAASLGPLAQAVARPGVTVLAPQAALVDGTRQWYPNSFLAPLEANEPALGSALAAVGRAVEDARALGVADAQVVLGGFSQGACLAAEYAARNARRWGGVVALSGALIGTAEADDPSPRPELAGAGGTYPDKAFDYDGDLAGTSVFLGCAERDPHIPLDRLERSATVLADLGGDVTKRVYPGDTHAVVDDEVQFVRELLDYLAC